jgi:hypothetical protein
VNNIKVDVKEINYGDKLHSFGTGSGPAVGSFEHGNQTSGCIRGFEFLKQLWDYFLEH